MMGTTTKKNVWYAPRPRNMPTSAPTIPATMEPIASGTKILKNPFNSSFSRQLCVANAVPVQHLVVIHCDGHLDELAREFEGTFVSGNRRATIASDIETGP